MTNCMYEYGLAYGGFKKVQSKIHIPLKICFTTFYFLFYHTVFKENIAPPGVIQGPPYIYVGCYNYHSKRTLKQMISHLKGL